MQRKVRGMKLIERKVRHTKGHKRGEKHDDKWSDKRKQLLEAKY